MNCIENSSVFPIPFSYGVSGVVSSLAITAIAIAVIGLLAPTGGPFNAIVSLGPIAHGMILGTSAFALILNLVGITATCRRKKEPVSSSQIQTEQSASSQRNMIRDFPITRLPEDILAYILTFLSHRHAVSCMLVSKKFITLWKINPLLYAKLLSFRSAIAINGIKNRDLRLEMDVEMAKIYCLLGYTNAAKEIAIAIESKSLYWSSEVYREIMKHYAIHRLPTETSDQQLDEISESYFYIKAVLGRLEGLLTRVKLLNNEEGSMDSEDIVHIFEIWNLVLSGNIEDAKKRALQIQNIYWRSSAYKEISMAQIACGEIEYMYQTIREIDESCIRMQIEAYIWQFQTRAADMEVDFRDRKQSPKVRDWHSNMLVEVLQAFASYGKIQDAKALAVKNIQDAFARFKLYLEIVKIQATLGKIHEAQETAQEILTPYLRSRAFVEIAKAQIALQDGRGTEAIFNEIQDIKMRSEVQAEEVKTLASLNIDVAKQAAKQIKDDYWRLVAFIEIVKSQALSGNLLDVQQTINTVSEFQDRYWHSLAYQEITEVLISSGNLQAAMETVKEIKKDEKARLSLMMHIATLQAESDDRVEGMKTAAEIEDSYYRTKTYCHLLYTYLDKHPRLLMPE